MGRILICSDCGTAADEGEWTWEFENGIATRVICPGCKGFAPKEDLDEEEGSEPGFN